jgi:hypothetical protein
LADRLYDTQKVSGSIPLRPIMETKIEDQFFDCDGKPVNAGDVIIWKDLYGSKIGRVLRVIPKWIDDNPCLQAEWDWEDGNGTVKAIVRLSSRIKLVTDPDEIIMYVLGRIGN